MQTLTHPPAQAPRQRPIGIRVGFFSSTPSATTTPRPQQTPSIYCWPAHHQTPITTFLPPICTKDATAPADPINMLLARPAANADYSLLAQNGKTKMIFNAHGGLA